MVDVNDLRDSYLVSSTYTGNSSASYSSYVKL